MRARLSRWQFKYSIAFARSRRTRRASDMYSPTRNCRRPHAFVIRQLRRLNQILTLERHKSSLLNTMRGSHRSSLLNTMRGTAANCTHTPSPHRLMKLMAGQTVVYNGTDGREVCVVALPSPQPRPSQLPPKITPTRPQVASTSSRPTAASTQHAPHAARGVDTRPTASPATLSPQGARSAIEPPRTRSPHATMPPTPPSE